MKCLNDVVYCENYNVFEMESYRYNWFEENEMLMFVKLLCCSCCVGVIEGYLELSK